MKILATGTKVKVKDGTTPGRSQLVPYTGTVVDYAKTNGGGVRYDVMVTADERNAKLNRTGETGIDIYHYYDDELTVIS